MLNYVEQYLFRPREKLPGVLMNAMRRLLEWQRREGIGSNGKPFKLNEFTLMFTTQVGPTGLPEDYMSYLRDHCLASNLATHQELKDPFLKRSNGKDPAQFFEDDFDGAFKLAVPKSLSELALGCAARKGPTAPGTASVRAKIACAVEAFGGGYLSWRRCRKFYVPAPSK
jgi:hypothetical protein